MQKVIKIDGGIGRIICAEPALRKLSTKEDIIVLTSWPDALQTPHLDKVYWTGFGDTFNTLIKDNDLISPEPYHNHLYYNEKHHLIQSFDYLLNGNDSAIEKPDLYLTEKEILKGKYLADKLRKGKLLIAFQPFGSTATYKEDNNTVVDPTHRSLPFHVAYHIVDRLADKCNFINLSNISVFHPSVSNFNNSLRDSFGLVNACDYVISIDSLLSHVGYALNKKGMNLTGATSLVNFGYPHHYYTVSRSDYPKSKLAFRIHEDNRENKEALNFSEGELTEILDEFKNLFIG